jgi:hypothetical protein
VYAVRGRLRGLYVFERLDPVYSPVQMEKVKKITFKWKVTAVCLQVTPNFYAVQIANYVQYKFATFLGGNAGDSTVDHATVLSFM